MARGNAKTPCYKEMRTMPISRSDVEPYVAVVEQGYASLWFLSEAMQKKNHTRTIQEVYQETIGKVQSGNSAIFNQGTCLFAAYLLLVVPKEANLKAFTAQLGAGSLSLSKFSLKDGNGNPWSKKVSAALSKLRNSIAHANFRMLPNSSRIKFCNYPPGSSQIDFTAEVELKDLLAFCEQYEKQWVKWANNLP
jgi:hypothetical protein